MNPEFKSQVSELKKLASLFNEAAGNFNESVESIGTPDIFEQASAGLRIRISDLAGANSRIQKVLESTSVKLETMIAESSNSRMAMEIQELDAQIQEALTRRDRMADKLREINAQFQEASMKVERLCFKIYYNCYKLSPESSATHKFEYIDCQMEKVADSFKIFFVGDRIVLFNGITTELTKFESFGWAVVYDSDDVSWQSITDHYAYQGFRRFPDDTMFPVSLCMHGPAAIKSSDSESRITRYAIVEFGFKFESLRKNVPNSTDKPVYELTLVMDFEGFHKTRPNFPDGLKYFKIKPVRYTFLVSLDADKFMYLVGTHKS